MKRIITSGCVVVLLLGFIGTTVLGQHSNEQQPVTATTSVPDLIAKGKAQYKSSLYKSALESFEAALQQAPANDEVLSLAAITAFKLDMQDKAREYYSRRASLPNQKPSIKAYCNYSIALSNWRDAHDTAVIFGILANGKISLNDEKRGIVNERLNAGFERVMTDASSANSFPQILNVKNLLHAEAALTAKEENMAAMHRKVSLDSLRKAIELSRTSNAARQTDDFSKPTVRVSEYRGLVDGVEQFDDPMLKSITGGRPIKKANPTLPGYLPANETPEVEPNPDLVKVEVLISTTGDVVFARPVTGRPEFGGPAVFAARKWKFEPALFENYPVQISSVIVFDRRKK